MNFIPTPDNKPDCKNCNHFHHPNPNYSPTCGHPEAQAQGQIVYVKNWFTKKNMYLTSDTCPKET